MTQKNVVLSSELHVSGSYTGYWYAIMCYPYKFRRRLRSNGPLVNGSYVRLSIGLWLNRWRNCMKFGTRLFTLKLCSKCECHWIDYERFSVAVLRKLKFASNPTISGPIGFCEIPHRRYLCDAIARFWVSWKSLRWKAFFTYLSR